jgi:hypothetical protein
VKKMVAISVFIACMLAPAMSAAQSMREFASRLEGLHMLHSASVRVTEHGTAADIVRRYDDRQGEGSVTGYRIRIFFDNSQNARTEAQAIKERFTDRFPSIPAYISYESPSWIVTVGNCITIEEALIMQNMVGNNFPTAFIWRGKIPLSVFTEEDTSPEPDPAQPADTVPL